jgi:hypothetical protein
MASALSVRPLVDSLEVCETAERVRYMSPFSRVQFYLIFLSLSILPLRSIIPDIDL